MTDLLFFTSGLSEMNVSGFCPKLFHFDSHLKGILGCRNLGWSYFLSVFKIYWYNQCQPETLFCSFWEISYIMITSYLTAMCFYFWLHLNVYLILHVHWFTMICFILFFCKLIAWICSSFLICRLIFLSALKYFQLSYLHILLLTDFFYCSSHFEPQIHIFSTFSQIPIYSLFGGFPMIFFLCGGVWNFLNYFSIPFFSLLKAKYTANEGNDCIEVMR